MNGLEYSDYYNSLLQQLETKISHKNKLVEILENDNHQVFQFCTNLEEKLFKRKKVQKDLDSCEKEIEKLNKEIAKQKDREENDFRRQQAKASKEQLLEQKKAEREKRKSESENQVKSKKLKQQTMEELEKDAESGKLFEPKDYLNLEISTENFELSKFIKHMTNAKKSSW